MTHNMVSLHVTHNMVSLHVTYNMVSLYGIYNTVTYAANGRRLVSQSVGVPEDLGTNASSSEDVVLQGMHTYDAHLSLKLASPLTASSWS